MDRRGKTRQVKRLAQLSHVAVFWFLMLSGIAMLVVRVL